MEWDRHVQYIAICMDVICMCYTVLYKLHVRKFVHALFLAKCTHAYAHMHVHVINLLKI